MAAGRKRKAARKAKSPQAKRPKSKQCPKTGKLGYRTPEDAAAAMAQLSRKSIYARAYRCPFCGRWHLTTQKKKPPG